MTPQPSGRAAGDTRRAIASARLLRAIADLRWDLLVLKTALRLHRRYDPNQPRVPAGSAEGGQWTSGGGTSPREMSGRRGRPFAEGTPAQQAVMVALRARIDAAAARIKDRDPTWRRPESMISGTVESRIEHMQAVAAAAEAHEAFLVRWGIGGLNRPRFVGGSNFQIGWSHDEQDNEQVLSRGAGARGAIGAGSRGRLPL
ncbi:MAG: hypothetical protein O9344_04395, partial [Phreatobacter sp.]|nr:hypothetical protein [Phreatobacter sp.]